MINRLGFNNEGHAPALERLKACTRGGLIGVNIGANKDSARPDRRLRAGDPHLCRCRQLFHGQHLLANTPGLRDLQARESLAALLSAVLAARDGEVGAGARKVPCS